MDTSGGAQEAAMGKSGRRSGSREPKRQVLFVSLPSAVPESLIVALEREIPWISVGRVRDVADICKPFNQPVSIIAIEPRFASEAEIAADDILRWHPDALVAVIDFDRQDSSELLDQVLESNLFRAVLPLNLRFDVWLSVIELMLRGGEYYPSHLFRRYRKRQLQAAPLSQPDLTVQGSRAGGRVGDLTPRELQILAMVSSGHQNKVIAAEFGLSEHTVKVHLHNIINKLGTSNRTEAAAIFLGSRQNASHP